MADDARRRSIYIESLIHLKTYEGRFDEIYPMHGSFPVKPELIGKLIKGAEAVRDGKAERTPVEIRGKKVMLCRFPYTGFLCDP